MAGYLIISPVGRWSVSEGQDSEIFAQETVIEITVSVWSLVTSKE